MVLPSNVDSLVLNITVTCSFPSGSSAPSPPLPHVSDDSFSSLTRFPPISSFFFVSSLATLYSTTLRNPLLLMECPEFLWILKSRGSDDGKF
jgi:hypothetical protein